VVAATGTTAPVIGPAGLDLAEGVSTIVYAWDSLDAGNLQLAVQTIDGLHSAPAGVPSGELGLPADDPSPVAWLLGVGAVGVVGALVGTAGGERVEIDPVPPTSFGGLVGLGVLDGEEAGSPSRWAWTWTTSPWWTSRRSRSTATRRTPGTAFLRGSSARRPDPLRRRGTRSRPT
jgi:hypothetical protein